MVCQVVDVRAAAHEGDWTMVSRTQARQVPEKRLAAEDDVVEGAKFVYSSSHHQVHSLHPFSVDGEAVAVELSRNPANTGCFFGVEGGMGREVVHLVTERAEAGGQLATGVRRSPAVGGMGAEEENPHRGSSRGLLSLLHSRTYQPGNSTWWRWAAAVQNWSRQAEKTGGAAGARSTRFIPTPPCLMGLTHTLLKVLQRDPSDIRECLRTHCRGGCSWRSLTQITRYWS